MTGPLPSWDVELQSAGGEAFAKGLRDLALERGVDDAALAQAARLTEKQMRDVFGGTRRLAIPALARLARTLRSKPIEFMQKTSLLSLEVYAMGLDPLFFLPDGQIRYDARIYMREINPRHPVPESDMTGRNPALKALAEDHLLDALGRVELELAYLLRTAVQHADEHA